MKDSRERRWRPADPKPPADYSFGYGRQSAQQQMEPPRSWHDDFANRLLDDAAAHGEAGIGFHHQEQAKYFVSEIWKWVLLRKTERNETTQFVALIEERKQPSGDAYIVVVRRVDR